MNDQQYGTQGLNLADKLFGPVTMEHEVDYASFAPAAAIVAVLIVLVVLAIKRMS